MRLFTTSKVLSFLFLLFISQSFYSQTPQEEAQEMLNFVNGIRADRGIPPLVLNANLNSAAYNHSDDMARNNYFSHTGLNNSNFSQRVMDAGYSGSPRGENIAAGNSSVSATFNQWVNSAGHLSNMLNANANEMGVGHASFSGSTYTHYWTQVFGKGSNVLSNDDIVVEKIKVYPNPVKDILYISLQNNSTEPLHIKLLSATGRVVYHQIDSTFENELKLNVGYLPAGVYFLYFQNSIRKIVKY
jgi:uncharacterized protein YkwD